VTKTEKRTFDSAVVNLAGGEKSALMSALDTEHRMRDSVVKIQRAWRWHMFRKACKDGTKKMAIREKAIRELVSTEESYVESLKLLIKEYMAPLRQKGLLNMQQLKELFVFLIHLNKLLYCYHHI